MTLLTTKEKRKPQCTLPSDTWEGGAAASGETVPADEQCSLRQPPRLVQIVSHLRGDAPARAFRLYPRHIVQPEQRPGSAGEVGGPRL